MIGGIGEEVGHAAPGEERGSAAVSFREDDFVKEDDSRVLFRLRIHCFAIADEFIEAYDPIFLSAVE